MDNKWTETKLIDIADSTKQWSIIGGPFGSNLKQNDYTDSGIRIIQLQNIGEGEFLNSYQIFTSEKKANELISCNIYPGEIIIAKMGDPVARACIIPEISPRFLMASDGIRLAPDKKNYKTKFILFSLNSEVFKKKADIASTGSTRKRIGLTELKNLTISIPPLPEQDRIVAVLETWDHAIDMIHAIILKKKTIYKILKYKFIFKRNDVSEHKVRDLFNLGRGRIISKNEISNKKGPFPVYSSQTSNEGILGKINTYDYNGEYITWTTDGANAGKVFYRNGKFNCTNVCGIAKVIQNNKINLYYVTQYLNYITKQYVSYVGNPKLMNGVFAEIIIKLPSLVTQNEISSIFMQADQEIRILEKKLTLLKEQKKYLLNKLVTGEIPTPENLTIFK